MMILILKLKRWQKICKMKYWPTLAYLLVGGDKGGADQRRFYKRLIAVADDRYDRHLASLQKKESKDGKKTR
jgi:hypothetical protein